MKRHDPLMMRNFIPLIFLILTLYPSLLGCSGREARDFRTFRMAVRAEPPTLDWTLATDSISFNILTNIMEGLTQYNANLKPVPALAERWEFSEDGKTLRYYLRDDVYWTDGKPVTAMDFEFSWKRLLNPTTAAQYAYFLSDVENAVEYNSGEIKDPSRVGVTAVSPHILEVRLNKPVVYFPSITTFMVTFPQREDIVKLHGDRWTNPEHIVTNGPFRLSEWHHEYKLVLKTNENFYDTRPGFDAVKIYIVEEPTTALTLYETGELDVIELPPVATRLNYVDIITDSMSVSGPSTMSGSAGRSLTLSTGRAFPAFFKVESCPRRRGFQKECSVITNKSERALILKKQKSCWPRRDIRMGKGCPPCPPCTIPATPPA